MNLSQRALGYVASRLGDGLRNIGMGLETNGPDALYDGIDGYRPIAADL